MNADELLKALQEAGLPVRGLKIPDKDDASTWEFFGDHLTDRQRADALVLTYALLHPAEAVPVPIAKLDFLRLLTPQEYFDFWSGSEKDPVLRYGQALMDASPTIDPTDPNFLLVIAYCVRTGRVTQDRADEIIAAMRVVKLP